MVGVDATLFYRLISRSKILSWLFGHVVGLFIIADQRYHNAFDIILTVDVEPGYIKKDTEERVWEYKVPKDKKGYTKGLEAVYDLCDEYNIPATLFISNQCKKINLRKDKKFEYGAHLHIRKDADDLTLAEQKQEIRKLKRFVERKACRVVKSFRWGAWGANTQTWKILSDLGFKYDSSVCPGCKGERTSYDWRKYRDFHGNTIEKMHDLLIVPCTTAWFGKWFRMDPCYLGILDAGFKEYLRKEKTTVFVIATHSSEMIYEDGSKSANYYYLERFIKKALSNPRVKFIKIEDINEKDIISIR